MDQRIRVNIEESAYKKPKQQRTNNLTHMKVELIL